MSYISPNRMTEAYQKIGQMKQALEHAKEKLQLYRDDHTGAFVGGVEYTQLIREIDAAIAGLLDRVAFIGRRIDMYNLMNVPHAGNKRAQLTPSIENQTIHIRVIDPQTAPPFTSCGVGDLYIGDHLFDADDRDGIRMIVGRALITAIEKARDIGYRQAQADIRNALGISSSR